MGWSFIRRRANFLPYTVGDDPLSEPFCTSEVKNSRGQNFFLLTNSPLAGCGWGLTGQKEAVKRCRYWGDNDGVPRANDRGSRTVLHTLFWTVAPGGGATHLAREGFPRLKL